MITNHSKKNYQNELKEWAMNCLLETLLQMKEEETLSFPDGTDKDLWEVGGLDCLIDEAVAWAEYRLGKSYKENGIIVDGKDWRVEGDVVNCSFSYKAGKSVLDTEFHKDRDLSEYTSLAIMPLSPNSLRFWNRAMLEERLRYRYGERFDDYADQLIEEFYPNV